MNQRKKIYDKYSVVLVNQGLKRKRSVISPITPYVVASGIDGIFSVYATYGLVHMYINNTGLGSTVSSWFVEKSLDGVTYTSMLNPKDLTNGYYSFGTVYILDHDFDYNTKYYYRLSYKPISSSTLVVTGLVTLTVPSTITDTFASEVKFPALNQALSGVYYNIYSNRAKLRETTPINYKLAFQAYMNQDFTGTRRGYNSAISGTNHNYISIDSSNWSSTWSGLSQAAFESLLSSINAVVNAGGYIHYLTNDGIIKDRMLSAWRAFVSGVTTHSGQYNYTLDMFEGAFGGLLSDGYNNVYGYISQNERDTFAAMCYPFVSGYRYGNAEDSNGFDAIRFGDTHSNEDTGILLRTFGSLLYGELSDSTLRAKISGIFYSNLDLYTTHMGQLDLAFLNDGSGGSTPYAGEYEFNEAGRIMNTMYAMRRMGYIDYFTYSGWVHRAKYTAFMQYPNGRVVNTGDGGFLYLNPNSYAQVESLSDDNAIIYDRQLALYNSIENTAFNYDFTHKTLGVLNLNESTTETPDSYGLDWYSKNKGMLISRSSWNDDAVILQVLAPRHQHFDKLSYDDGSFTIYYKGYQIPRAGIYDSLSDSHDNSYRKRTYAGNTITVYQSGELFVDNVYDPGVTTPGSYPVRPNNGDQPIRRLITSYTEYNTIDRRHGNTRHIQIQSGIWDITYFKVDLTPAYWRYTSASNYQELFDKKVNDVTREFFFVKPSGVVVLDRVITTNSGYVQKNIVHFEKEPTLYSLISGTIVPRAGISGCIELYSYQTSGITEPFESGAMAIRFLEASQPIQLYKIGGIGYEYWDSASGMNRPPTVYDAGTTGTYDDTEYGRGKWRIEWQPSGYTTTGLYAWIFLPISSGQTYPAHTTAKLAQLYANDVRSYQFDTLVINTNATANSGILNSRYNGAGISGHLFVGLYPRTDFTFKVQNSFGTVTYQTYNFTSADIDYSFGDLNETGYNMTSSGYQLIIPTGLSQSTSYRYLLTPSTTAARNEATLNSSLQSGLQLWLVAEDIGYPYDNNVLLWTDRINGFVASGFVLPYPKMRNNLREGNYHQAVRFGKFDNDTRPGMRTITASGYMQINDNSLLRVLTTTGYTLFIVHYPRITNAAVRQNIIEKGNSHASSTQRQWGMHIKDGLYQTFIRNIGATQTLASATQPAYSEMSIDTLWIPYPAVNGNDLNLIHNGDLVESEKLTADINTAGTQPIRIGFGYGGTAGAEDVITNYVYPYVGDVYEILIYQSGLTSSQVSGVWSYLATKYNIAMSGYVI